MLSKTTKNRFSYKLDKIFWFFIAFLPLISWVVYLYGYVHLNTDPSTSLIRFSSWVQTNFLLSDVSGNIVFQTLTEIFGDGGVFPLFDSNSVAIFFWLIMVEVVHVFFDIIVFIPRLAHKWISKAVQDD